MSDYEDDDASDYEQVVDEQVVDEDEINALDGGAVNDFNFNLDGGDKDSGFHTKNDTEDPFQRSNVTQRKGAVDVKCTVVDIVHGEWGEDDPDSKATLVVLLFRFDSRKNKRRVAMANIKFKFFDMGGRDRKNPEVVEISLNDSYSMVPTKRTESTTTGAEGTAGGGALGANLSGTVKWEKKIDEETTDATRVVGSIDRLGPTKEAINGPSNAATWTLTENKTTKTGVPAAMRVGILLKRQTDDDFKCTVEIETKVDIKTQMEEMFGGREPDDPILFRTSIKPTNKLMKYDVENLGSFNVSTVEHLAFTTMKTKVIKGLD